MTSDPDGLLDSIRRRRQRYRAWAREGEPTLGRYLAQVGVLGWMIVVPALLGVFLGRWIDRSLGTGIFLDRAADAARPRRRVLDGVAMDARPMIADVAFFAAGLPAGTLHFALLRWNASLYARRGRMSGAMGLQLVRLVALGCVLALIARQGALPLLLATLGVLIARPMVTRMMAP